MTVERIDVDRARALIEGGATVVDVLPEATYRRNHIPGAVSHPLESMTEESVANLDRHADLVVYCYDQRCDLSARASARLDSMGFEHVHDLIGGRAAWTLLALPTEGSEGDRRRVAEFVEPVRSVAIGATIADVEARVETDDGDDSLPIAVLDADGVLLGALDRIAASLDTGTAVADAMVPAPGTIRPDMTIDDAVAQLRKDGLPYALVTTARGELLGALGADAHI